MQRFTGWENSIHVSHRNHRTNQHSKSRLQSTKESAARKSATSFSRKLFGKQYSMIPAIFSFNSFFDSESRIVCRFSMSSLILCARQWIRPWAFLLNFFPHFRHFHWSSVWQSKQCFPALFRSLTTSLRHTRQEIFFFLFWTTGVSVDTFFAFTPLCGNRGWKFGPMMDFLALRGTLVPGSQVWTLRGRLRGPPDKSEDTKHLWSLDY